MGNGGGSLINIGDLVEPAKVLIEKISSAIGWYAAPYQVKRMAKAEVEAEKIRLLAQIEISETQKRGLDRLIQVEGVKQDNIEKITAKTIVDLKENARPAEMENDWIANFFDKCSGVSDEEMQTLWARILANEANKPGTYSKRTVNSLSSMDKNEAYLFTTLCRFGWSIGNITPLIYDLDNDIYAKHDLNFVGLNHLDSIGLISFNNLAGYVQQSLPKKFKSFYFDSSVQIELPEDAEFTIELGSVLLTKMGLELAPICGATPIEGFVDYVISQWVKRGYLIDKI